MASACRRHRAARLTSIVLLATLAPSFARAADPPKAPPATAAETEAHQHAARAHDLYQQGAYRESISELEVALKLDPTGKGLVFNLGVVHEKLGDIEDALRYFQQYEQMDLDPQERAKADAYVKRLQGARHEVAKPPDNPPPPPPPPPPQERPRHGRIDAVTIGAAVLGVGGLAVGTIFGFRALSEKPKSGATIGGPGASYASYSQLQISAQTAHNAAIVSDIGFAAGVVGVAAAAVLFLARTRDSSSPSGVSSGNAGPTSTPIVVSGTPLPGGGALFLGARF